MMRAGHLVSCIVPTGDRAVLLGRCLDYWSRQTYQDRELCIVDGGQRAAPRWLFAKIAELDPTGQRIKYQRVDPSTNLGERRQVAIEMGRGPIVAHFDDDDWYHPTYLERLYDFLLESSADFVGTWRFYYYDFLHRRGWRSNLWEDDQKRFPIGATFFYWRRVVDTLGYPPVQRGEDDIFLRAAHREHYDVRTLEGPELYAYIRHMRNVTGFQEGAISPGWTDSARQVIAQVAGDLDWYDDLAELVAPMVKSAEQIGPGWHLPGALRK